MAYLQRWGSRTLTHGVAHGGPLQDSSQGGTAPHQALWTGYPAAAAASHFPSNSRQGQVQVVAAPTRKMALLPPVQPSIAFCNSSSH